METDTYDPNGLIAGDFPLLTRTITVKSGQNLTRGAVLGIDSTGKALLSLSGASDGSQNPAAILAFDVNATGGDKTAKAYFTGEFNAAKLTIGTGHTAASVEAAFVAAGIPIALRTLP